MPKYLITNEDNTQLFSFDPSQIEKASISHGYLQLYPKGWPKVPHTNIQITEESQGTINEIIKLLKSFGEFEVINLDNKPETSLQYKFSPYWGSATRFTLLFPDEANYTRAQALLKDQNLRVVEDELFSLRIVFPEYFDNYKENKARLETILNGN